ncbi:hypothetical protein FF2_016732 [Malus domestica]
MLGEEEAFCVCTEDEELMVRGSKDHKRESNQHIQTIVLDGRSDVYYVYGGGRQLLMYTVYNEIYMHQSLTITADRVDCSAKKTGNYSHSRLNWVFHTQTAR